MGTENQQHLEARIKTLEHELEQLKQASEEKSPSQPAPIAGIVGNVHDLARGKDFPKPKVEWERDQKVIFKTIIGSFAQHDSQIHLNEKGETQTDTQPDWNPRQTPMIPSLSVHYWWIDPSHPLKSIREDAQTPHKQDEIYYILNGEGEFQTGRDEHADVETMSIKPGDLIYVPHSTWHRFIARPNTEGLSILIFFAPDYTG